MDPYFDYDSQPVWAGSSDPNLDMFLPMTHLASHIVMPPAGREFRFYTASAMVNPFANKAPMRFPAAPPGSLGLSRANISLPGALYNPSVAGSTASYLLDMDPLQRPAEPMDKDEDKTSSIPLVCLLCPNKPKFSDTSHLLTHISSKSHLAAQFKLQHSGKSEDKLALDQYKLWSDTNGVDKLVANRIAAKEKKPSKKQRLTTTGKKAGKSLKLETDDSPGVNLENSTLRPNLHGWNPHTLRDNAFETLYSISPYSDHSAYPLPESPLSSAYIKQESSRSGTDTADASFFTEAAEVDDGGDGGDASKLKGTIYPGMGLFDAATPLQKRKRNQKKHASVVRNMELTSASIGRNEEVWDFTMSEVTRTRDVYASPSVDGSPDEVPSTTRKRRARRPAVASSGPRRQTRAVTRAANNAKNAKVGKRRSARQAKKLIKLEEDELDSEGDVDHHLDDEEEGYDASAGDDVFQEHRQARQEAPAPAPGNRFDFPYRNAMNALPSNTPLMSSSSLFPRSNQNFFPGFGMQENDSTAFSMHQPGPMHGYFHQNRPAMQASTGGFNPLYLQRQETYPFLYGGHSFEASKPPTPAFQTMNAADFASMDPSPFQPGQPQHEDFDV